MSPSNHPTLIMQQLKYFLLAQVTGPEEGNLVGIDMPGIIQCTELREDEQNIQLIQDLTEVQCMEILS